MQTFRKDNKLHFNYFSSIVHIQYDNLQSIILMSDMYTSILNFTRRLFEIKSNGSFGLFPLSRTLLNHLNTPMLHPLLWPPPTERSMFHMMLVTHCCSIGHSVVLATWLLLFCRLSRPIYLLIAVPSFHLVLGCPLADSQLADKPTR